MALTQFNLHYSSRLRFSNVHVVYKKLTAFMEVHHYQYAPEAVGGGCCQTEVLQEHMSDQPQHTFRPKSRSLFWR